MMVLCRFSTLNRVARAWLLCSIYGVSVIFAEDQACKNIDYDRIFRATLWLFPRNTVEVTLKVGFVCLFVVIDLTYLGGFRRDNRGCPGLIPEAKNLSLIQ